MATVYPSYAALSTTTETARGVNSFWQTIDNTTFFETSSSTPMFNPTTAPDGAVLQLPALQKLQIAGDARGAHFGLSSAASDNSGALNDALEWMFAKSGRKLTLDCGTFDVGNDVVFSSSNIHSQLTLQGQHTILNFSDTHGMRLEAVYADPSKGQINGLRMTDIAFRGGGTQLHFRAETSNSFIYNIVLDGLSFVNFAGDGLRMEGNVFEVALRDLYGSSQANTTGSGIHLTNGTGTGLISSIDIYGGTWRYGMHGLYAEFPVSDLRIYGGTYLFAQKEGINITNAIGVGVYGVHVEGNWQGAADFASGGAGLRMDGSGFISGVTSFCGTTQKQKYAVRSYTQDITVAGGAAFVPTGGKFGLYGEPDTGSLVILGKVPANYDGTVYPNMINYRRNRAPVVSQTENVLAYSAAVTADLDLGAFVRVTLTGNLTFNNPTKNDGFIAGDILIVELTQDATGGRSVTWGSDFLGSPSPIATASGAVSHWTFVYASGKWRQTAFA